MLRVTGLSPGPPFVASVNRVVLPVASNVNHTQQRAVAVVDGANVAYEAAGERPKVSHLLAMRKELEEEGFDPVIILDASLRHEIDDPDQLEALLDQGVVLQAPADTSADYFVLKLAGENDAVVVSNDQFRGYRDEYPWIADRKIEYMVIGDEVHLHIPQED